MEKTRDHQRELFMCFIDYKNALDCVDHQRLWCILKDMGVPDSSINTISTNTVLIDLNLCRFFLTALLPDCAYKKYILYVCVCGN